jgi:hypothetical protein
MSELSKQALKVDNNQSFPNNNAGAITPAILRAFNEDMIDSTVNQTTYTADSASWDASIDTLTTFSASQHTLNQTLATTGSNTFNGNQTINGTLSVDTLDITSGTTFTINADLDVSGSLVADLPAGYIWLGGVDGRAQSVPSSSIVAGGSTDISALNQFTASQETKNATLATYTGSNDTKWNTIGSQSGSWVTESETGSFARTDITNTFTQTQIIQGDLNITGTINATTIHTITESASVIYSSGSNVFGDDGLDTQTLNGATTINGDARLNGTTHQITGSLIQTGGNVTITGSILQSSGNATFTGSILSRGNNTFIGNQTITGTSKQTFNEPGDNQEVQVVKVNGFTDSNGYSLQNNTFGWYHYNSEGHEGFASQLYTGDYAYGSAFFHDPEKWEYILFPSGAAYDTNKFGLYDVGGTKTKFIVLADNIELTGSVALTPASVSTNANYPLTFVSGTTISKDSVDTLLYNPSTNQLLVSGTTGNSNISPNAIQFTSGSGAYGTYASTVSKNGFVSSVEGSGYIAIQGNPSKTGAPSLTTSTKPALLALSSSGQPYPVIELQPSASFTDGRATFKRRLVAEQNVEITGSLTASGSATITGQLKATFDQPANNAQIDNLKVNSWSDKYGYTIANSTLGWQRYEGTVEGWVQELYTGDYAYGSSVRHEPSQMTWEIYPSGSAYDSNLVVFKDNGNTTTTFRVLADNTEITGSSTFKGSVFTSGSVRGNVVPQSITSATASFDFSTSNFFELNLLDGTNTRVEATNVGPGQTINVLVTQAPLTGGGTITFSDAFKFPAVSPYTASADPATKDILTFVTFADTSSIYSVAVKNMI